MDDWAKMIEEHGPSVYRAAWRILRHRQDVEDVVQDVFEHAWSTRTNQDVRVWGAWLTRLAVCRALDRLKRKRPVNLATFDIPDSSSNKRDALEDEELARALRLAVAELPERQSVAFSLKYFEGMSNAEIAQQLGISPSNVSTALHKARRTLANQLSFFLAGDTK